MEDIKDIISKKYFKSYKWFYVRCLNSKAWKNYHWIYDSSFRLIYQWNFLSIYDSKKFIDRYENLLNHISKNQLIIHDKYNSEYFIWWYNYYGELID